MNEILPEPVALIVDHPDINVLYLKPITAGAYATMSDRVAKDGNDGLTMENMVWILLTDKSKKDIEELDIKFCSTINDKLDILLPAKMRNRIVIAVGEAFRRGGMKSPLGVPLKASQRKSFLPIKLIIFASGLVFWLLVVLAVRWIYL